MNDFIKPKGLGRVKDNLKSFIIGATVLGLPTSMYMYSPELLGWVVTGTVAVVVTIFLGAVVRDIFEDFKE